MTKRVLLVGENPNFFEQPNHMFQVRGCEVFTAMTGTEAVSFLKVHGADLVITCGAPSSVSVSDFSEALGADTELVVIAPEGSGEVEEIKTFRGLSTVHVVDDPMGKGELLELTNKILGTITGSRKFISILVQVKVERPKVTTIFGKSRDLSETGMLVECSQPLILFDKVGVSFLIPGSKTMLQGNALVARDVGGEGRARLFGLKFLDFKEEEVAVIRDFLTGKLAAKE